MDTVELKPEECWRISKSQRTHCPLVGVISFNGTCRVNRLTTQSLALNTEHLSVLSSNDIESIDCESGLGILFLPFKFTTIDISPLPPTPLDELSVSILADTFFAKESISSLQKQMALDLIYCRLREDQAVRISPDEESFTNQIRSRLLEHLDEPITVEKLAKEFHCSGAHINAAFRKEGLQPPMKYLASLRIEHAMQLLEASELTISQTAAAVGYNDLPTFSRFFKKHTGKSPSEFRNAVNWLL